MIASSPADPNSNTNIARRLSDAATMVLVSMACFMLLIYIAYGTTKRTYEQLLVEKATAQAELVRSPMESYVRPGLPLRQYTGFNQVTNAMLEADTTLVSIVVEVGDGELAFSAGNTQTRSLIPKSAIVSPNGKAEFRKSDNFIQVIMPLRNKFERVGSLVVTMDRSRIDNDVIDQFQRNILIALLASLVFGFVVFRSSADPVAADKRAVAIAFTGSFIAVAIAVVTTMIALFTAGAESEGRALVDSLGQRFDDIPQFGLQFDQIDGIDEILESYRQLNPNISAIGITVNGRVAVHTDRSRIGKFWSKKTSESEYSANLTPPNHPRAALVIMSIPKSYVFWQVARNVKNYAALFVASALFAFLFLQLAQSIRAAHANERVSGGDWRSAVALDLVKPVFFVSVFVDNLCYAFLPQFIRDLATQNGDAAGSIALPFAVYYLCFALALVPSGQFSQKVGSRNLVLVGLTMVSCGLFAMTMTGTVLGAVLARGITGLGQGMLFIGVQNYILLKADRKHRTKANGIIVYGYQGGMISGMAIGSLLVSEVGPQGVFTVAAVLAGLAIAFTLAMIPADQVPAETEEKLPLTAQLRRLEIVSLLRDGHFMKTILLIGVPAKAVLTGVILFAVPLMLTEMAFAKEDIGQITMIYAGCVIISSTVAGHLADKLRTSRQFLVWGGLMTAAGLMIMSFSGNDAVAASTNALLLRAALVVIGAAVVGAAHGLINAPIITHITDTAISRRIGEVPTAAAYRFLERAGHMMGPVVLGQLFLVFGTSPVVLGWLGISMVALTLAFHFAEPEQKKTARNEEYA